MASMPDTVLQLQQQQQQQQQQHSQKHASAHGGGASGGGGAQHPDIAAPAGPDEVEDKSHECYVRALRKLQQKEMSTSIIESVLLDLHTAIFHNPHDANFYVTRAKAVMQVCDVSSGITNYRTAIRLEAESVMRGQLINALTVHGMKYLDFGEPEYAAVALSAFDEVLRMDASLYRVWMHKAVAHVHLRQFDDAFQAVTKSIATNTDLDADSYVLRGKIAWAMDLTDAGNSDFRHAERLDPEHPEVKLWKERMLATAAEAYSSAMAAMEAKDYEQAVQSLSEALAIAPQDFKCTMLRAKAYRALRRLDDALRDIERLALAYRESMQLEEERKEKEKEPTLIKPDPVEVERNLREELQTQQLKQLQDESGVMLHEPEEITRQRNLILNDVALNLAQRGHYNDATMLYNRIISAEQQLMRQHAAVADLQQTMSGGSPRHSNNIVGDRYQIDYRFYVNRGDCYRAIGKLDQALGDYHNALQCKPNDWELRTRISLVHFALGSELFNEGKYVEAEVEFSNAIQQNPKVADYYAARGKTAYMQANFDRAYEDYKACLKLNPNHEEAKTRVRQFEPDEATRPADETLAGPAGSGHIKLSPLPQNERADLPDRRAEEFLPMVNPHLRQALQAATTAKYVSKSTRKLLSRSNRPQLAKASNLWRILDTSAKPKWVNQQKPPQQPQLQPQREREARRHGSGHEPPPASQVNPDAVRRQNGSGSNRRARGSGGRGRQRKSSQKAEPQPSAIPLGLADSRLMQSRTAPPREAALQAAASWTPKRPGEALNAQDSFSGQRSTSMLAFDRGSLRRARRQSSDSHASSKRREQLAQPLSQVDQLSSANAVAAMVAAMDDNSSRGSRRTPFHPTVEFDDNTSDTPYTSTQGDTDSTPPTGREPTFPAIAAGPGGDGALVRRAAAAV